ncbi:MAG TPA: trehalose-phosphatase [Candidatus Saccharimonadales bacterium]|nr:trehalose-phosphatase [Candidatus Saccharimonadales bacterium]
MTIQTIAQTYASAAKRLLLLDYDGTLADFAPTPSGAAPPQELLRTLEVLAQQPANTVVIVSGRDKQTLTDWLSHLPVSFAAEHGYWRKEAGKDWQATMHNDASWKIAVQSLMDEVTAANPGSLIEEKSSSLVWHYRAADDADTARESARLLVESVENLQDQFTLRILDGNANVEVQLAGTDKGSAAQYWLQHEYDFILAAGDDTTDEDLFTAMPDTAYTIKVGPGATAARLHVDSPAELRQLLGQLAEQASS